MPMPRLFTIRWFYDRRVVKAARKFLKERGDPLTSLQVVVAKVFGKNAPRHAADDVLALCRQLVSAKKS